MGTRSLRWLGLLVVAATATFCMWRGADPELPPAVDIPTPPPAAPETIPPPPDPVDAARSRAGIHRDFWLGTLSAQSEPLTAAPEDPHAVLLRGRLTVRQRPWLHPARVEVRVTRSFLDTIVPTDAGDQDVRTPDQDDPKTTTDAEGRFTLRFAPTSGELFFLIDRSGDWVDFQRVPDVPRLGGELDLGDVFVDDRGGITGTVTDPHGRPLANVHVRAVDDPLLGAGSELGELRQSRNLGAEHFQLPGTLAFGPLPDWVVQRDLYLPFPRTTTDSRGRFRLRGLRPGAHDLYLQSTRGSEYGQGKGRVDDVQVADLRDTEIGEVRLRHQQLSQLRFVDERGRAWVSAEVTSIRNDLGFGAEVQRTEANGFAWLPIDDPSYRIAFCYPGGGPWLSLPEYPFSATVTIARPRPVTIRLIDGPGSVPIVGGRVVLFARGEAFRPVDRRLPDGMQPREGAPGTHQSRIPCEVIAVASAPGRAPAIAQIAPDSENVLVMLPLATLTVRTHDHRGEPIADAAVRMQVHTHEDHTFAGAQWTLLANDRVLVGRTDENGLLTVPVWDTFLSFTAEHPNYAPSPGPRVRPVLGEQIELLLRRNATLKGQLSFHHQPAPAGFRVRARQRPPAAHSLADSGWLAQQLAVTGENGAFAFRGLCAGIWQLEPELPSQPGVAGPQRVGQQWKTRQVSLEEGQEVFCALEAELAESATPQIAGIVTIDGAQVAGALVRVREQAQGRNRHERQPPPQRRMWRGQTDEPFAEPVLWQQRLTTDAFGDFRFADLRPGTSYELRIDLPSQGRFQFLQRRIVLTPAMNAKATRLDVAVVSGGLDLHCEHKSGPFDNRMMRLRQIGDDGQDAACFEVLTSPLGECHIDQLPVGTWTIEPMHGGSCQPAEFTIAAVRRTGVSVQVRLD